MNDKIEPWKEPKEERDKFEAWYVCHIGDLSQYPIGSRECYLQWDAWKAAIIAAHAPKQVKVQELSITVDQIQQAIDYGFTISGLEQELTKLIHAAEQADE